MGAGAGLGVGDIVGPGVGDNVGPGVGDIVGSKVGAYVGSTVGDQLGDCEGDCVGEFDVGDVVGDAVGEYVLIAWQIPATAAVASCCSVLQSYCSRVLDMCESSSTFHEKTIITW